MESHADGDRGARVRIGWQGVHDQYGVHVDCRPPRWEQPFVIYAIVFGIALLAVGLATPLTVLALRFLDKPSPTPIPEPAPAPEAMSGPERIDQITRRGRR